LRLKLHDEIELSELIERLESMRYTSSEGDSGMERGNYHFCRTASHQTVLTLWPPHERYPLRLEFTTLENSKACVTSIITKVEDRDQIGGFRSHDSYQLYPAKHHVYPSERLCTTLRSDEGKFTKR
jgi:hypothetical protein